MKEIYLIVVFDWTRLGIILWEYYPIEKFLVSLYVTLDTILNKYFRHNVYEQKWAENVTFYSNYSIYNSKDFWDFQGRWQDSVWEYNRVKV